MVIHLTTQEKTFGSARKDKISVIRKKEVEIYRGIFLGMFLGKNGKFKLNSENSQFKSVSWRFATRLISLSKRANNCTVNFIVIANDWIDMVGWGAP